MQRKTITKVGVAGAISIAISLGAVSPAFADEQPRSTDAVGVGSDTVQYVSDFVDDGSPTGLTGYNKTNTNRRVFSFDATADASGRSGYVNGTSTALASTVVLRAGKSPVTRPNGSGAGISALLADTATPHQIDFVRSSRLPTNVEQGSPAPGAAGNLHVFQIADDGLQIAEWSVGTSDVPAGLSAAELVRIYGAGSTSNPQYKKWGDVPGYTGPNPGNGIVPILPPSGSGTRKDFLNDLRSATGVDLTLTGALGANVRSGEEHDPNALNIPNGTDVNNYPVTNQDTIAPFSTGRDKLIDTNYFAPVATAASVNLLTGTAPDAAPAYFLPRHLYIIVREADVSSTTPFQAGGTQNLVNSLFGTPTSWYAKGSNVGLFTAAGVTQDWQDLNNASSG